MKSQVRETQIERLLVLREPGLPALVNPSSRHLCRCAVEELLKMVQKIEVEWGEAIKGSLKLKSVRD